MDPASSWLQAVIDSVHWWQEQIGLEALPPEVEQLRDRAAWESLSSQVPLLKKGIQMARKSHLLRIRMLCEVRAHAQFQHEVLRDMQWEDVHAVSIEEPPTLHICQECHATFCSPAALAVHQTHKHQKRSVLRRFATDANCRACGRHYHTRARLLNHLQASSTSCWLFHLRMYAPLDPSVAAQLDEQDRSSGQAFHQRGLKEAQVDRVWRYCHSHELCHILPPARDAPLDMDAEPTEQELSRWSTLGLLPPGRGGRAKTSRSLQDAQVPHVIHDLAALETELKRTAKQLTPQPDWVPRPLADGRRFVLLLYSGHRRLNDMASWLTGASDLVPIPIDVAIDPIHGDVLGSTLWPRLVRARKVAAVHAGPPCETFSLARWIQTESGFPRPLRARTHPWGVPFRTLREVVQLTMGGILFLRGLAIQLLVFLYGGATTLEHPRGCDDADHIDPDGLKPLLPWCVWQSGFIQQLLCSPEWRLTYFLQGPLGREFAKPTVILASRLNGLATAIYQGYDKRWRPTSVLGGQEDGQWRTAKAKAYPDRLCQILAQQYITFDASCQTERSEPDPDDLQAALDALTGVYDPYLLQQKGDRMHGDFFQGHGLCT
eukprot:Skav224266  [mRNA]  locus=scaffold2636:222766:224574:- [translate_table: standard]